MRSDIRRPAPAVAAALALLAAGLSPGCSGPDGPGASGDGDGGGATAAGTAGADSAGAKEADSAGAGEARALARAASALDGAEVPSLAFEPPPTPEVHRYELLRDGRSVGRLRAEIAGGQEGMVELRFRLRAAGTTREGTVTREGAVTTAPRLFFRYARLTVEAEADSPLPLLTVLAPPALEAVVLAHRRPGAGGGEPAAGEPVEVDGTRGLRLSRSVGGVRVEAVASPDRLLPVEVRTTLPDGTVLEARPRRGPS